MKSKARKFSGYAPVRAAKGFGPRHVENVAEGEEVDLEQLRKLKLQGGSEAVPSELPSPPRELSPLERWRLGKREPSLKNIPLGLMAALEEAGGQLAGQSKEDWVKMAISMMPGMGGEGPVGGFGKVPKMESPGLKFHDTGARYEGPPEPTKQVKQVKSEPSKYMESLPPENEPIDPAVLEKYWADFEKQTGQKRPPEAMKRGKTKVGVEKGHGPRHAANAKEGEMLPNTDTVPAMLTPREAVLNRNAAEMAGRGNIEALNAEGNELAKRGVDLAGGGNMKEKAKKMQGGAAQVPGQKSAMYNSIGGGVPNSGAFPPQYERLPAPPQQYMPRGMTPFQGGASEVGPMPIGSPNPQTAYDKNQVQLSAGDVSKFLQQAGQQQGLSAGQISGLMKAFSSFGGGGGYGSGAGTGNMDAVGAFAGGISDIGYPPFVAPGADYHADKGGWLGPYDPAYTYNSYARGIASVPFR